MENKITQWSPENIDSMSLSDKLLAMATISYDYSYFDKKEEDITEDEMVKINGYLNRHILTNGSHGLIMAVKIGRAIRTSIQYPIKPKTGLVQRLKNKVKELLS